MAKTDRKDDGRRCIQCNGPALNGILPRFVVLDVSPEDHPDWGEAIDSPYDMHDVCTGSWLMSHPGKGLRFHVGEIKA